MYLVIMSAGFGRDAGLALTNSQYSVQSCFGMSSTVFRAGWFFNGPLNASHIRQPKPHMSDELQNEKKKFSIYINAVNYVTDTIHIEIVKLNQNLPFGYCFQFGRIFLLRWIINFK